MPSLGFKDIEFGKADGQTECTYHPELLLYGFLDAYKYIYKILDDYKFLILGPKGSGKTAIAGRLKLEAERTKGLYVDIYYLENFPYGMFKKMIQIDESPEILYPIQWEFFLLVALFDSLCKDNDIRFEGKYKDLRKGLTDLGIFPGKSLVEMTKTVSKKEFKVNLCNYIQGGTYSERQKINIGIETLMKNLDEVCFSSKTQSKHFIILDKLDNVLLKKEAQFESLAALVLAADSINKRAMEAECNSKIIILCRNDLYDRLDNPNLGTI